MPQPPESPAAPPWLGWFQLGLSSMLAVLFLVVLVWSREQGREMRQLRMRLETLESSRSLEQAADQSSQLRVLTDRIQALETQIGERIERSDNERLRLQQLLSEMRGRMPAAIPAAPEEAPGPAMARRRETSTAEQAPVLRPAPPASSASGQ